MSASAGTAWVEIKPNLDNFGRELSSGISRFGSGVSSIGRTLTSSVTTPILAAAGAAGFFGLKTAASLEQAEVAFTTLTGSAETGRKVMQDLKDLGKITPFETTDLTTTAQRLLNAGVATDDLTKSITFLGDAAGTQGAQGLDRLGFAYSQILGSGRAMTEDINQIADVGVPIWGELAAQLGVTQTEVRKMASEGKISADVITKSFEQPIGPMKNLVGGMQAQSATLTGLWSTFKDTLGQGLADSLSASMPQIKQGLTDLTAAIGPALSAAGPAFSGLVQAMVPLIGKVGELLTWFSQLSPQMQQWIVYAVAGAGAMGPLLRVFGPLVTATGGLVKGIGGLVKAGAGIAGFASKIVGVFRAFGMIKGVVVLFNILKLTIVSGLRTIGLAFLTNPVGLIITAIVAVIAGAAFLIWKYWDQIKAAFAAAIAWITPIVQQIWQTIVGVFTSIWGAIKGVFDAIVGAFQAVWGIIVGVFNTIVGVFQSIMAVVVPIWNTFFAIITLPIRIWWTVVQIIFQLAWAFIQFVFNAIVSFVTAVWSALWDFVSGVLTAAWGFLQPIFSAIWNFIVTVFNGIKSAVLTVWNALWDTVKSVWNTVYGFISSGIARAKDVVVSAFETMRDKIRGVWDGIKSIIQGAVDAVQGIASGIWSGLKSVINSGIGLLNSAISGFNKIIGAVNKVPGVNVPTIPTIPKLAEGGVVSRPTVAMVGEAGPEAVIPLSKLNSYLDVKPKEEAPIYLTVKIGDRDITDMIQDAQRRREERLSAALAMGRRL
jgi:tape measure domain-containing protein